MAHTVLPIETTYSMALMRMMAMSTHALSRAATGDKSPAYWEAF